MKCIQCELEDVDFDALNDEEFNGEELVLVCDSCGNPLDAVLDRYGFTHMNCPVDDSEKDTMPEHGTIKPWCSICFQPINGVRISKFGRFCCPNCCSTDCMDDDSFVRAMAKRAASS
ncbi:MAG: hypothetical protein MUO26_11445 [Methanotrichaceae archaeon]|nr:hypothetical protein [Methanotrichaceae archaeon]